VLRTGAIETFCLLPSSPHSNDAPGRNEVLHMYCIVCIFIVNFILFNYIQYIYNTCKDYTKYTIRTGAIETCCLLPSSPHSNDAPGRNEV